MAKRRAAEHRVVDTNVAMVAQGLAPQADQACVDACQEALAELTESFRLVLDEEDEIASEYVEALGHAGKPGVGRAFAKWVWDSRFDEQRVMRVAIRPQEDGSWRVHEEFPDQPDLKGFDRNDQKFVAVALASGVNPPILNAVDSDWWEYRRALEAAGVRIKFLCPTILERSDL